jgi:hypothetical protein
MLAHFSTTVMMAIARLIVASCSKGVVPHHAAKII